MKPVPPVVAAPAQASKPKKASCKLEVPPKLVFSMLKDRELASKLRALRLPTDGKRQVGACLALQPMLPRSAFCLTFMPIRRNLSRLLPHGA